MGDEDRDATRRSSIGGREGGVLDRSGASVHHVAGFEIACYSERGVP